MKENQTNQTNRNAREETQEEIPVGKLKLFLEYRTRVALDYIARMDADELKEYTDENGITTISWGGFHVVYDPSKDGG